MINIELDKKSGKPLYVQIRDQVNQAIENGAVKPGDKLPTVAAFAKSVGVTQATIRRAFEDLKKQGKTQCHVGRGTFVSDQGEIISEEESTPLSGQAALEKHTLPARAARQLRQRVSKGLCDLMTAASRPGTIDFSKGVPDPGLMDEGLFEKMVGSALQKGANDYLSYGDLQGMPELRECIAARYGDKGVAISPDQVLITVGSQQGVSIAAVDAAEKSRQVFIETPGFQGVVDAFTSHGNWVETVTSANGMNMADQLASRATGQCNLLSLCPEFQNPTGETFSIDQRQAVASWARQNNGIVLSDEVFEELRLDDDPVEPMIRLLGDERTILVSSLSKSLMPGLRVGWMISSSVRIREFMRIKRLMAQTGPPLMQGVATAFLQSNAHDEHLEKVKNIYRERRDTMLLALNDLMPDGVSWTRPTGGFSLWVTLPQGYSSVALLISLLDKGVNMAPGPIFDMNQGFVNAFRLGWAWTDLSDIQKGMELLAEAVKELLRRSPGDAGLSGLGHF